VVVLMAMIVALLLGAAFSRQSVQRLTVKRQLAEYRRHHEMFGVRAIVRRWLNGSFDKLPQILAETEGRRGLEDFAYGFVLPSGATVRVYVSDGQGAVGASEEGLPEAIRAAHQELLDRLPEGVPGLRRTIGPAQVSINAAPRDVLEALVKDDGPRFADRILTARAKKPLDREQVDRALDIVGVLSEEKQTVLGLLAYQPSLWRLDVLMADEQGERVFRMLTDRPGGQQLRVHEWVEVPIADGESAIEAMADPDFGTPQWLARQAGKADRTSPSERRRRERAKDSDASRQR
jgi:hypothetical protein